MVDPRSLLEIILDRHSPPVRVRILQLWQETLRAYVPRIEPEGGHFTDLIDWLETVAQALEVI